MSYVVIIHLFGSMPFGHPFIVTAPVSDCRRAVEFETAKASKNNSNGDQIIYDERMVRYCARFPDQGR